MNFKDLIDYPHKVYEANMPQWNFLLNSYEGGRDYTHAKVTGDVFENLDATGFQLTVGGEKLRQPVTQSNLFEHPKERSEDFKRRLRMSYYYNFCSPIIDTYTNHLFRFPVVSEYGKIDKSVQERADDVDLMGSSIDEFRKEIAELAQVYGHIFILTDTPRTNPEIRTLKDKIDNKAFPFFTLFKPQDVLNWALDGFGRPYWVLLRELGDVNSNPESYNRESLKHINYRLWTREEWILLNQDGNEIERERHGLGHVPLTCTFDKKSKKARNMLGISFLADIAYIARDLYNSCSELRQILRDQTFSFLILQGDASDYSAVEIATNKGLRYPKEVNQPAFISPEAQNAEVYFKHIDRQVDKMFELAMQSAGSASFKGQGAVEQSGVSKAWDFNQTNSALAKKAMNLEDGEVRMWNMWARWEGKEWDGSIQYPHDFNIQDLISELEEAKELLKLGLGDTFATDIKKALVKKKFPAKPDKEIDKIVLEFSTSQEGENTFRKKVGSLFKTNALQGGKKTEEEDV